MLVVAVSLLLTQLAALVFLVNQLGGAKKELNTLVTRQDAILEHLTLLHRNSHEIDLNTRLSQLQTAKFSPRQPR